MKTKTMKAVVKYENKPNATELREVPVPEIGESDVLVEVAYVGVCGTDPHMHNGSVVFNFNCPFILGHEFAGRIVEAGKRVSKFKVGERVTSETHADYCGRCALCRTNNYHLCRERKGFGFHCDGAFTKYVKVPERILHRVPESVSLKAASITEPFCVAYKSVVSNSAVKPGDKVVVIGPGPIGLLCMKMAQLQGASEIVAVGAGPGCDSETVHECGASERSDHQNRLGTQTGELQPGPADCEIRDVQGTFQPYMGRVGESPDADGHGTNRPGTRDHARAPH
ncbi:MAG: alcohol dehydrogenase catalytic domain-containing protein [Acidobacteriota bacterium]